MSWGGGEMVLGAGWALSWLGLRFGVDLPAVEAGELPPPHTSSVGESPRNHSQSAKTKRKTYPPAINHLSTDLSGDAAHITP